MELKSWDALQGIIKERACMTCQILCSFLYCAYDLLCVFLERQTESWLTNLNVKKSHLKLKCVFLDVIQVVSFFLCFFFCPFTFDVPFRILIQKVRTLFDSCLCVQWHTCLYWIITLGAFSQLRTFVMWQTRQWKLIFHQPRCSKSRPPRH